MSDDQDGCEWVSVSSGTGLPGLSRTKAVKRLCVCKLFMKNGGGGRQCIAITTVITTDNFLILDIIIFYSLKVF